MSIKKTKVLFIASLPQKGKAPDGETQKSKDVVECIKYSANYSLTIINYSKNKYIQTIKLIFFVIFKKYERIFISKCVVGGTIALHMILKFGSKHNRSNIVFYLIGNGDIGFEHKKFYLCDLEKCKHVIVESPLVKESILQRHKVNCVIFPCLKPPYQLAPTIMDYGEERPLRIIFFSRIVEHKGIIDAIEAVKTVNEKSQNLKYVLDVSGGGNWDKDTKDFNNYIISLCHITKNVRYIGLSLKIDGVESYKRLQSYDLHILPTKNKQECAPGSIFDMFIAGVPTLSSNFPSSKYIIDNDNSYFFDIGNKESLIRTLEYIYDNKNELNNKRRLASQEATKYTYQTFLDFLHYNGIF